MDEYEIETKLHVYASQLPQTTKELSKIMGVISEIAQIHGRQVSPSFTELAERVAEGVRVEELPFSAIKGIGRDTCRELYRFTRILKREEVLDGDSASEILKAYVEKKDSEALEKLMSSKVSLVGSERAKRIVEVLTKPSSEK